MIVSQIDRPVLQPFGRTIIPATAPNGSDGTADQGDDRAS